VDRELDPSACAVGVPVFDTGGAAIAAIDVQVDNLEAVLPALIADVPGRCEPGTGEISYPAVAAALDRLGYTGVVGLEGWASGDPELALQRFHTAFTVN